MPHEVETLIRRHSEENPWTYAQLDLEQKKIAERVRSGGAGAILISEVAPVITVGRRTAPTDLLFSESELAQKGIALLSTDRGGFATYHGPGQWILFVVHSLEALTGNSRGVRAAIQGLLEIGLEVTQDFGKEAEIHEGDELGIWSSQGKLAAVGVHIEKRVLQHGLSLNVYRTALSFQGLRPCGLDKPVDYLSPESLNSSDFNKIAERLKAFCLKKFNFALN